MSFEPKQFRGIIEQQLKRLGLFSPAVVELLLGTAAQESYFGTCFYQQGLTPGKGGIGFFQMEAATEKDIWRNYLAYRPALYYKIAAATGICEPTPIALAANILYQITMARLHYRRVKQPLPPAHNIMALAQYWDRYYNKNPQKGTPDEFLHNYKKYCRW